MTTTVHRRSFHLPLGYRVTFEASAIQETGTVNVPEVRWTPGYPCIESKRAQRKFSRAYFAARDEFVRELATMGGVSIVVIDTGDYAGVTMIEPEVRH